MEVVVVGMVTFAQPAGQEGQEEQLQYTPSTDRHEKYEVDILHFDNSLILYRQIFMNVFCIRIIGSSPPWYQHINTTCIHTYIHAYIHTCIQTTYNDNYSSSNC